MNILNNNLTTKIVEQYIYKYLIILLIKYIDTTHINIIPLTL